MIWEDHSRDIPKGKHALFGGSAYSWTNIKADNDEDFEETLRTKYYNTFAKQVGTLVHEWCADRIKYRKNVVKANKSDLFIYIMNNYDKHYDYISNGIIPDIPMSVAQYYVERCFPNVMNYIKDANGFRLDAEVNLKYADEFYGTADAILYKKNEFLRIHDLKTGSTPASLRQLEIYAAFCCLEYDIDPSSVEIELRIYQNEEILVGNPTGDDIKSLMDQIKRTKIIFEKIKKEG